MYSETFSTAATSVGVIIFIQDKTVFHSLSLEVFLSSKKFLVSKIP